MKFIFVETVDDVLKAALEPDKRQKTVTKTKNANGKKTKIGETHVKSDAH
jgi:hypothetical protein